MDKWAKGNKGHRRGVSVYVFRDQITATQFVSVFGGVRKSNLVKVGEEISV